MSHMIRISERLMERIEEDYEAQIEEWGIDYVVEALVCVGAVAVRDKIIGARLEEIAFPEKENPTFCIECGDLLDHRERESPTGKCQICQFLEFWDDHQGRGDTRKGRL